MMIRLMVLVVMLLMIVFLVESTYLLRLGGKAHIPPPPEFPYGNKNSITDAGSKATHSKAFSVLDRQAGSYLES